MGLYPCIILYFLIFTHYRT